ncbi:MAG: GAF domain-containing protein [Chitinivibrionales bacterium]
MMLLSSDLNRILTMEKIASRIFEHTRLRLNRKITPSQFLSDFLSNIHSVAQKTIGTDKCSLFLTDFSADKLVLQASIGLPAEYQHISPLSCRKSTEGRAVAGRKPVFSADLYEETECAYKDIIQKIMPCGLLCIPLKAGQNILGVVNFYTTASPATVCKGIQQLTGIVYKAATKMHDMALLGIPR